MSVKSLIIGAVLGVTAGLILSNCPPVKKAMADCKKQLKKMTIDYE